jgi:hypothetical protein
MNITEVIWQFMVEDDGGVVPDRNVVLVLTEDNEPTTQFIERIDFIEDDGEQFYVVNLVNVEDAIWIEQSHFYYVAEIAVYLRMQK